MKTFNILIITSTTASFELDSDSCFYSVFHYDVIVNGKTCYNRYNKNVFSLFNLVPRTRYKVRIAVCSHEQGQGQGQKETKETAEIEFSTPEESCCLKAKAFGAKGDGRSDDTGALQTALMACPPGGRVLLEAGTYVTGPLFLKSNMTLELKKGAVLYGSPDRDKYPVLPESASENLSKPAAYIGSWEGEPGPVFASLITGFHLHNTAIVGEGVIDGGGKEGGWWNEPKKQKTAWRPKLVFLAHCRDIIFHGVKLQNSPSWTLHPYFSSRLDMVGLDINNPKDSPNTDGINPESCDGVNIIGTSISVGDDCIAVKSGKKMMGEKFNRPSRELVIRNCLMQHGHGAVVLGSEMSGGILNMSVTRCLFSDTDRGLRIKTCRGRGKNGVIDGIFFENIKMKGVLTPLVINMFYHCDPDGKTEYVFSKEKLPVDGRTPRLDTFVFKNISCEDCEVAGIFIYGLPEQKIGYVYLENIDISFKTEAAEGFAAMMCRLEPTAGLGIYMNQVSTAVLKKVRLEQTKGEPVQIENVDSCAIIK